MGSKVQSKTKRKVMIPKKPDSITAEDARKLMEAFRKKPLQWISNIPPEAD